MLINSLKTFQNFSENFGGIPVETRWNFFRILAKLYVRCQYVYIRYQYPYIDKNQYNTDEKKLTYFKIWSEKHYFEKFDHFHSVEKLFLLNLTHENVFK